MVACNGSSVVWGSLMRLVGSNHVRLVALATSTLVASAFDIFVLNFTGSRALALVL